MLKNKSVLLVGGEGYIGTVISNYFLKKNYYVTSLDDLIYRQKISKKIKSKKRFKFIKADLRNKKIIKSVLKDQKNVILLAGLVGDPITKKYPSLSKSINQDGIKYFINQCKKRENIDKLIFVSTCSNYGIGKKNNLLNEKSPLKPLSLYAKQKVNIEKFILSQKKLPFCPIILRFATAFGVSPRMRFDLTINHFTKSFLKKEHLKIFDENTSRPYCHVLDFARSIEKVLKMKRKKIYKQVFNIGSNKNNFSKKGIIKQIAKIVPMTRLSYLKGDFDKRDYKVDFTKGQKVLNFIPKYSVAAGIKEIRDYLKVSKNNKNIMKLGNYIIKK